MSEVRLLENPAESYIRDFTDTPLARISPISANWQARVALEVKNLMSYVEYLKSMPNSMWFYLRPNSEKYYNYQKWDGYLFITSRPDIKFAFRIILTSQYPYVYPRAFAEESIADYCAGNLYPNNIWKDKEDPKTNFVMICHDHMKELHAWNPGLSITHFLIREVYYWWMSKVNRIIFEWDKKALDL